MRAALAFIVDEEEGLVLLDWPAERSTKLILPEGIETRQREDRASVSGIVLQVIVSGAMHLVGSGLGDNVDDAAERPPVLGPEAVVHYTKFADRFLRGRRPLRSVRCVDIVGAIHGHGVVQVALAAEGNPNDRRVGKRGLSAGMADRDAWAEKREIGEEPAANWQGLDLLGVDNLADFRLGGLDGLHFGGYNDLLAFRCHLQDDIERSVLTHGQHDPCLRVIRKTGIGDL